MDSVKCEELTEAFRHGIPFIKSGPDGQIYACNQAFEDLLGYSSYELKRKGWIEISVKSMDLEADKAVTAELVMGQRQTMTVVKSYVSKLGVPIPGQLTAVRYPQGVAPLECVLCFFQPLANGSKAAVTMVIDYIQTHTNASKEIAEKIATMAADIQINKRRTTGEKLWDTAGEWALENPKLAVVLLLILLSLNPLPIITTWLTRMGWLPAQPVQLEIQDATGKMRPASVQDIEGLNYELAHQIVDAGGVLVAAAEYEVTTKDGDILAVTRYTNGSIGPLSFIPRRISREVSADPGSMGRVTGADAGTSRSNRSTSRL
jgi:PAS domain S-box-containing protein